MSNPYAILTHLALHTTKLTCKVTLLSTVLMNTRSAVHKRGMKPSTNYSSATATASATTDLRKVVSCTKDLAYDYAYAHC